MKDVTRKTSARKKCFESSGCGFTTDRRLKQDGIAGSDGLETLNGGQEKRIVRGGDDEDDAEWFSYEFMAHTPKPNWVPNAIERFRPEKFFRIPLEISARVVERDDFGDEELFRSAAAAKFA